MRKRNIWLKVGAALIIVACIQGYLVRNYLIIGPGPVQKLEEMVTVETGNKDAKGAFLLTAVTSAPAGIPSWIAAMVSPDIDIAKRAQEIPKGMDLERYISIMESLMRESQVVAGAVALERLGFPVSVETVVRIEAVLANSPAKDILQQGDIILAVDDRRVTTADEAVKIISLRAPGEEALLTVSRQGKVKRFKVGTGPHPEDRGRAAVGILVSSSLTYDLPINIEMDSRNVKGSSGGLMFTLEILNQLDPVDLTGGQVVAGTGTIGLDGVVGPIAGIKQKVIAAERGGAAYFLVPMENVDSAAKIASNLRSIQVVGVSNIDEAIRVLDDISRRNNGTFGE
jgi:PDZ domain-containing protein